MILTEPLRFQFFVNGLMAAILIGALTGFIGVFIVLRKMSYIGHGLSHAIFGGAVVSYVMNWSFYLGAGIWGLTAAMLINRVERKSRVSADAAIGIVTTASFAIGVALISRVRHFTRNFEAALFGNVLGVTRQDLWVVLGVMIFVALAVFLTYRQLVFLTFDREVARAYRVPVDRIDALFSLMLAATIIASIQIMGVTLIAATVVIPASIARLLTNSLSRLLFLSTIIGAACGGVGMYLSYYLDVASGATIVILAASIFALVSFLPLAKLERLSGSHL